MKFTLDNILDTKENIIIEQLDSSHASLIKASTSNNRSEEVLVWTSA